jgi:hypothetical protein
MHRPIDVLRVFVSALIDDSTVEVNVIGADAEQRQRYRGTEIVRLVHARLEDEDFAAHIRQRLLRRHVRCFVHGRDADGRIFGVLVPIAG